MLYYSLFTKIILILWPVLVAIQALFYRKKQNGLNPWTGGPISWPKAFWLAYTIDTWFLLPFLFLFHPELSHELKYIIIFHLLSWWIRGILELVMIYKWFNWTPRYGILHDSFHWLGILSLLILFRYQLFGSLFGSINFITLLYLFMLLITTIAEIYFAYSFMKLRTEQELKSNIYFASDDPKWIYINRVTLTIVVFVYLHLIFQSSYALYFF